MKFFNLLCLLIFSSLALNANADHPSLDCESNIPGFTFLGDHNDAKYFISQTPFTWSNASQIAADNGGYIASINTAAENNFLSDNINEIVLIGLNDEASEGSFEWDSGEGVSFNNLSAGNTDGNDYGVINFWDGSWGLVNQYVEKRFLLEVPCGVDPPTGSGITIINCPQSFSVQALAINNYSAFVDWVAPTATTDCASGGLTITQIVGPAPGGNYGVNIPDETIVYEVSDACGNVENCVFFVNVFPEADEIICPDNITVTATSGNGAQVFFDDPEIITYCNPGNDFTIVQGLPSGSVFPIGSTEVRFNNFLGGTPSYCQNFINCVFTVTVLPEGGSGGCPDQVAGFTTIGEFGTSKYFLSASQMTWQNASQVAQDNDGYLASINSQSENDFLKDNINSIVMIGLNDANSEGNLQWDSGESLSVNNLSGGNTDANDYGVMNFWDGSWGLVGQYVQKRFILEVPCDNGPPNNDLPDLRASDVSGLANSGEVGEVVDFQFLLSNIGQAIVSGNYNVNTYLSTDANFSNNDILVGEVFTGSTPIGSTTVDAAITVPNQPEGNYYLIVVADALGQVAEENENNNSTSVSFRIENEVDPPTGDPFCAFDETYSINSSLNFSGFEVSETNTGLILETRASTNGTSGVDFEYTSIDPEGVASSSNIIRLPTSRKSKQGNFAYTSQEISPTSFEVSLVDVDGNSQWTTTVNIQTNDPDIDDLIRYDFREMSDHFIGFGFYHFGNAAKWKSFMYKLDLDGNLIWEKTFEEISYFPSAFIYEEASDGGTYLEYGNLDTRVGGIRKVDSNGNVLWTRNTAGDLVSNRVIFGGESGDESGVFFAVWSIGNGRADITKLNPETGSEIWNVSLANEFKNDPTEFAVGRIIRGFIPTNDGGVIANVGYFQSSPTNSFIEYGRLDSNGEALWSFDMPEALVEYAPVLALSDGGFIFGDYLSGSDEVGLFYVNDDGSFLPQCGEEPSGECPTSISGFTALGEFNGSAYFLSNTNARPVDAQLTAEDNGGYLAVIESQEENDFLQSFVNGLAYIGMNDFNEEGVLEWNNGTTVDFTNFDDCGICLPNSANQDFVIMQSWNGGWSFSNFFNARPYIIEVPCESLQNGSIPQGRFFSEDDKDLVVVEVYPNPTVNSINIAIVSPFSKVINYQIYDANGRGVHSAEMEMSIGENVISIDVSKLTAGLYHIYFPDAHTRKSSFRFMRIH